jgi:hypothetical protein
VTVSEADWAQLEAEHHPHGLVTRRLFPQSPHDIFLAVRQPAGTRMLLLRVPDTAAEAVARGRGTLPTTRGLDLRFGHSDGGRRELQVILTAEDRREVFNPLIADMAATAGAAEGAEAALTAAIDRFEQWRHLLQSVADSGLGREARRGLYGELVVLRDHVLAAVPPTEAVRSWTGPTGANQDFELPGAAVEVKTGAGGQPQSITIANERQLDDTGVERLLLAHLLVDERRGGSGESLNAVVDSLRNAVGPAARVLLDDLLARVAYLTEHRHLYDEPRYTQRGSRFWRVTGDFPRITEADLRPGVGDCRYRISTVGLDRYRVLADEVGGMLRGVS